MLWAILGVYFITKLRTAEYRVNEFYGVGKDCVMAYGE